MPISVARNGSHRRRICTRRGSVATAALPTPTRAAHAVALASLWSYDNSTISSSIGSGSSIAARSASMQASAGEGSAARATAAARTTSREESPRAASIAEVVVGSRRLPSANRVAARAIGSRSTPTRAASRGATAPACSGNLPIAAVAAARIGASGSPSTSPSRASMPQPTASWARRTHSSSCAF